MAPGRPLLVAIDMGYGHLRAASALASALDVPVQCVDEPPLADADEQRLWARARWMYEFVSRASQLPVVGGPFDFALGALTQIPDLYPIRDLSAPTLPVRYLARQVKRGLGRGLVEHLRAGGPAAADHVLRPGGAGRHRRPRPGVLRGHRRRREPHLGTPRRGPQPYPLSCARAADRAAAALVRCAASADLAHRLSPAARTAGRPRSAGAEGEPGRPAGAPGSRGGVPRRFPATR